ncbi:hypothetical protein Ahy_B06g086043 isoform C [Arachis hypogaea]|uniref:Uncharacterized protein n=1 Tax=Arachis hypogaea TaxID=3818 RepID=A0A444YWL1_ARAHY|nr:hypothetical protein Ahy_B06g086043 isoform C [Arachis hypogaea]
MVRVADLLHVAYVSVILYSLVHQSISLIPSATNSIPKISSRKEYSICHFTILVLFCYESYDSHLNIYNFLFSSH